MTNLIKHPQRIIEESYLYETLTYSVEPNYAVLKLNNKFANSDFGLNFSVKKEKILCKFISQVKKLNDKQFLELLNTINFFGYYPSFYITYNETQTGYYHLKYNEEKVKRLATEPDTILFYIVLEPKYNVEINENDLPDKLYHVSATKNEKNILKFGLAPKAKEKMYKHPNRIYFTLNIENAEFLTGSTDFTKGEKLFTIFEFDFSKIKKNRIIKFFKDENFGDDNKAVYTLENIPPQYLKVVRIIIKK